MWPETKSVTEADFLSIYSILLPVKPVGNYKGFWLLISILEEIFRQKKLNYNLTRDIYPEVAVIYNCSSNSIERNLRTLLLNIDISELKHLTGADISTALTVSQLIDILVGYLILCDI